MLVLLLAAAVVAALTWEQLYEEHAATLFRQARRLCGPGVDPEDVVHDVFLIAHKRIDQIDPAQNPGGYLFGILFNVAREHRRRRARREQREALWEPGFTHPPAPDETVAAAERRRALDRCLARLPDKQRMAVALVDMEQRSTAEAAELLRMSPSALYTNLSRGRAALVDAWRTLPSAEQRREGQRRTG